MTSRLFALLILSSVLFSAPALAAQQSYTLDSNHNNIIWHANHFGFSNPSGRFGIKDGTLILDEQNPNNSRLDVTVDVAGLATGLPEFDQHIKSPDFLDAKKFPTARFVSTKVERSGDNAKVTGNFTLHGVTKPLVLNVHLNKIGEHPFTHAQSAGFTASTVIKRSQFGIDKYIPAVSDDIKIDIESEANLTSAVAPNK